MGDIQEHSKTKMSMPVSKDGHVFDMVTNTGRKIRNYVFIFDEKFE